MLLQLLEELRQSSSVYFPEAGGSRLQVVEGGLLMADITIDQLEYFFTRMMQEVHKYETPLLFDHD